MTEINLKEKTPEQCLAEYCHRTSQKILEGWLKNQKKEQIEKLNEIIKIILENGEKSDTSKLRMRWRSRSNKGQKQQ